jgi:hypothetical protein
VLPPVFAPLLLFLLVVSPVCQADSSGLPGARCIFKIMFDVTSSQFRSCAAATWVQANLSLIVFLVCGPVLLFLFHFFFVFSCVLELGAP